MEPFPQENRKANILHDASEALSQNSQPASPLNSIEGSSVPVIRSLIVLRRESFGGYVFNPYLPPETKLDQIRFRVATLCDGRHTVDDIKQSIADDLEHSKEYISLLVEGVLKRLNEQFAIYWQKQKRAFPKDLDLIKSNIEQAGENATLSAPLFAIWEITSACNLKCEHCLSDAGKAGRNELSTQEAKGVINSLSEMKVFNITFSGGEPLLRPDIFELLEYASEKRIGIDLLTNGALITENIIDRLEKTNVFNVQVSVDGIEETHDNFRGLKGSYKQALNAIEMLLSKKYNVAINSVVTKQNMEEIPKIIDKAVELGVEGYKTTLFMPAGRGKGNIEKLLLTPHDVKSFTLRMIEKKKEVGDKIKINVETDFPWLNEQNCREGCSKLDDERSTKVGCTAGSTSLYITSEGKIAPCPFLRQIVAGDVRESKIANVWGSSAFSIFRNMKRSDLKGKCHNCQYLGISCYGGCRAAALAHTGDLYAEDPTCWKHLA